MVLPHVDVDLDEAEEVDHEGGRGQTLPEGDQAELDDDVAKSHAVETPAHHPALAKGLRHSQRDPLRLVGISGDAISGATGVTLLLFF